MKFRVCIEHAIVNRENHDHFRETLLGRGRHGVILWLNPDEPAPKDCGESDIVRTLLDAGIPEQEAQSLFAQYEAAKSFTSLEQGWKTPMDHQHDVIHLTPTQGAGTPSHPVLIVSLARGHAKIVKVPVTLAIPQEVP